MKLYYSPIACSLAVHIALNESGLPYTLEKVIDLRSTERKTENGEDFLSVNPAGYVPALKLENGRVITEGGAILEYIADLAPNAKLAPAHTSFERTEMRSWLYFLATEILKGAGPLFNPTSTPEARQAATTRLQTRFAIMEKRLSDGRSFLLGEDFSVADCYAYVVVGYAYMLKLDMSAYPKLTAYINRIGERPTVKEAKKEEGQST